MKATEQYFNVVLFILLEQGCANFQGRLFKRSLT